MEGNHGVLSEDGIWTEMDGMGDAVREWGDAVREWGMLPGNGDAVREGGDAVTEWEDRHVGERRIWINMEQRGTEILVSQ